MEIQLWRELLEPYALAVDEIVVKFEHLIEAYRKSGSYSPIEQVKGRLKSISSILEKCQKKGIPLRRLKIILRILREFVLSASLRKISTKWWIS